MTLISTSLLAVGGVELLWNHTSTLFYIFSSYKSNIFKSAGSCWMEHLYMHHVSSVSPVTGHFCFLVRGTGVKTPLMEPLRPEVPHQAVMSCQLLLLYSLIVKRSVSHPVSLTAGVPLVTPQCPVPVDAIVAAPAAEERRCGPAGCETILGRKRRESRSCVQKPGQPSVS